MKLLLTTETERELAAGLPSANVAGVADADLEAVGAWLTERACEAVVAAGFEITRAHRQSVGAMVIVQSATPQEREAWDDAIARNWDEADRRLLAAAKSAAL